MNKLQSFFGISFFFLIPLLFPVQSDGKGVMQKKNVFRGNWKFDLRTGYGAFLSKVPSEFLDRLNGVNIPVGVYSPAGVFALRKAWSPHFEMGYQLDYTRVNGFVGQDDKTFKVNTTAFTNSLVILYMLKREDASDPRLNYQLYYKVGSLALKNNARERFSDGSISPVPEQTEGDPFIRGKALTTGLGLGANWRFSGNFSLLANLELNQSTYRVSDIFQPYAIFVHSPRTITSYGTLTVGLSYSLRAVSQKTGFIHHQSRISKKQFKPNHRRIKRKNARNVHSIWYKQKKHR